VSALRGFEIEALRLLLAHELPAETMHLIENFTGPIEYDYSGCGYFLVIRDQALPDERSVYDRASGVAVVGRADGIDCGFIVFIAEHRLVLECHPWSEDIPPDYRDRNVVVSIHEIGQNDGAAT
jgi:hypothetical protein